MVVLPLEAKRTKGEGSKREQTQMLSGSNATPLVSRYSCRATLVSQFSPYVFAMSHKNRATHLKVSQKRPCRTLLGGVSHLKSAIHTS